LKHRTEDDKAQGDLDSAYRCLMAVSREYGARLSSLVPSERPRSNG